MNRLKCIITLIAIFFFFVGQISAEENGRNSLSLSDFRQEVARCVSGESGYEHITAENRAEKARKCREDIRTTAGILSGNSNSSDNDRCTGAMENYNEARSEALEACVEGGFNGLGDCLDKQEKCNGAMSDIANASNSEETTNNATRNPANWLNQIAQGRLNLQSGTPNVTPNLSEDVREAIRECPAAAATRKKEYRENLDAAKDDVKDLEEQVFDLQQQMSDSQSEFEQQQEELRAQLEERQIETEDRIEEVQRSIKEGKQNLAQQILDLERQLDEINIQIAQIEKSKGPLYQTFLH